MAKSKKLNISDVEIIKEDGKVIISGLTKDDSVKFSVEEKFGEFVGESGFELKFKKKSNRTSNRKPTFKFECSCGKQIKSSIEDLHIKCKDCEEDFEISE